MRAIIFCLAALSFIGCKKVSSGHVGIKVHLLGGPKGVDSEELGVGLYWIGVNEELHLFPTYKQNYVWTQDATEGSPNDEGFTFQTAEGLEVGLDMGITYYLQQDKIHHIFQKYRRGVDEITGVFLRNHVRDALNSIGSTVPVESAYGKGKADLLTSIELKVKEAVKDDGIIVEKLYFIGKFRLPDAVTKALNAKLEATQRAQQRENEVREATAEADKKIEAARGVAESRLKIAKAEADANKIVAQSLTPELVNYEKIKKWDGKLPQVSGQSAGIILDMKAK